MIDRNKLLLKINDDNAHIMKNLYTLILDKNIETEAQLEDYEKTIKSNDIHTRMLDEIDIIKRNPALVSELPDVYAEIFKDNIKIILDEKDEEKIIRAIIIINDIIRRENVFPYQTYKLIMNDKL